jgi:hydrogenase maturation protease
MRRRVRVIACGNPDAGDDAVGLLVARAVRARAPEDVDVVESLDPLRVIDLLADVELAIVVDAVRSVPGAREAGELVRAEVGPEGLPADIRRSLSSHGLGLAEALGLAAALGRLPRVVFIGAEAADVTAGRPLSPMVAAAMPRLVERVLAEVAELRSPD